MRAVLLLCTTTVCGTMPALLAVWQASEETGAESVARICAPVEGGTGEGDEEDRAEEEGRSMAARL